jgi:hypothetical protein
VKRLVTWPDVNYTHEPGSYNFQDGILDLERTHLDAWERDLEGVWEVARNSDPARAGAWVPVTFHASEHGPCDDVPATS